MVRVALVVLVVAGLAAGAAPAQPDPAIVVSSFRATVRTDAGVERLVWQAPDRLAVRTLRGQGFVGALVERAGMTYLGSLGGSPGTVTRRAFAARPDSYSTTELLRGATDFVLAKARGGERVLRAVTLAGRPAWRARVLRHGNDCAGLPRGSEELWLDRRTLLPLRIVERRARQRARTIAMTYSAINATLAASEFAPPRLGRRPYRADAGFRRTSVAAAAVALPYRPRLPAVLPAGFARTVTGWARRSGRTGPEASNPRFPWLFAAVYRRGVERIDITQRLGSGRDWPSDPFGAECVFQYEQRTAVRGRPARYAYGPETTPHLYWREGRVLLTVSGPFPRRELVRIAASLAPAR